MKKTLTHLLAASLAVVTVAAYAETAPSAADKPPRHFRHGPHGDRQAGWLAGLAKLKAELKLSAAQLGQWQDAEAAGRAARESMRQNRERMKTLVDAEKKKDVVDLARLSRESEAIREQGRKQHEAVRDKWLAVYESLTVEQKRLVSERFKQKLARFEQRRERFREHHRPDAAPAQG
ncbi:Spy/CpxP family protein refolding chaperone [Chitinimonas koreensis]|uniref:Spy/CpxP family protein refolding chaperone n=1 Tax=Chitinimonas koreensis TaxID=356302 RepID=UPI00041B8CF2|nr:Spy/CpxP family protein refolding chaperone [Chitinimonas koreensis]QNM95230.1 Spy/CpxP family protein refolding chaperone [Chitinimonas koreensis]